MKTNISRRQFMQWTGMGAAATLLGGVSGLAKAATPYEVLVIGGGFAGATAAKYLKLWGGSSVNVTLIEPKTAYYSPILSNLVLNGNLQLSQLEMTYSYLTSRYGITHIQQSVTAIDGVNKTVTLSDGQTKVYDRLVIAPGMEFKPLPTVDANGNAAEIDPNDPNSNVLHAWKGGQQVQDLKNALAAMPAGGTFVMTIPLAPFRCPPGPYERACVVADWLKRNNANAKVIVLDANADILVEKDAFLAKFNEYGVEYHSNAVIQSVNLTGLGRGSLTVSINGGADQTYQADVLNIIPTQRAGAWSLLNNAGLLAETQDWVPVEAATFKALNDNNIYVIGDAQGTGVPKAGHIGNAEAKVCAQAVLDALHNKTSYSAVKINSACYSPVSSNEATWLTVGYQLTNGQWTKIEASAGAGAPTQKHYYEMFGWAKNLFSDTFA